MQDKQIARFFIQVIFRIYMKNCYNICFQLLQRSTNTWSTYGGVSHTQKRLNIVCMIRQSLLALFMNMFRVGFILVRFGFVKYQRWLKRIFESVPYTQKFTTIQNRSYTFLTCNIMMRLFVHKNVTQTKNDNQQTTKGKCESLKIFLRYNFICKRSCNFNLFVQKYKIYAK